MKRFSLDDVGKGPRKKPRGPVFVRQNRGVEQRNERDLQQLETEESREAARLAALERKAQLYESLQRRVDVDDEAANDRFEVDFIAKALRGPPSSTGAPPAPDAPGHAMLHPEAILQQQREVKRQMQGGGGAQEYSTYEEDVAELQAQHRRVDELNAQNAERIEEFEAERKKRAEREKRKRQESSRHKDAVLQRLLQSRRQGKT